MQANNLHLHNVPMQIAAERGLPALAVVALVRRLGRRLGCCALLDRARHRVLAAAALGAMAAMLTAGLFEYNFGDSEFLMLFLILITLPFAADRGRRPAVTIERASAAAARRRPARAIVARHAGGGACWWSATSMLDQFIVGRVSRISPEAPVPVVAFDHDEYRAGGAANVALNVARARRQRRPRSAWSAPTTRRGAARAAAGARTWRASALVTDDRRRTTTKVRIVTTRNQQVARIDYENDDDVGAAIEDALIDQIDAPRRRRSAPIVVSDYLKGVVTRRLMAHARRRRRTSAGIPVLVDPKIPHLDYYAGASLVTPNHHEAETATHLRIRTDDDAQRAAQRVSRARRVRGRADHARRTRHVADARRRRRAICRPRRAKCRMSPARAIPSSPRWRWRWPPARRLAKRRSSPTKPPASSSASSAPATVTPDELLARFVS